MAAVELRQAGWHITDAAFETYSDGGKKPVQQIINALLDVDLREVGEKSLPEGVNKGKIDTISGPLVMQIQKIRNVSAPKENEESQTAPRMLKLSLTDGQISCTAVEQENVDRISLNTPPGSKIKLKGHITMKHGFLLLTKTNTKYLGGSVAKLVEPWELKRSLAKHTRAAYSSQEGGPPQFIPFDQRRGRDRGDYVNDRLANNFKSLEVSKKPEPEEKKENDDDFAQQRKATIQEALKGAESKKTFGTAGKPKPSDPDVARLVDMGFPPDEAAQALRQNNNNISEAVAALTGAAPTQQGGGYRYQQGAPRGRGGRGERGRGRGRAMEEDGPAPPSKPSGPATLFDFLETKIKPGQESKYDTKTAVASASAESHASRSSHSSGRSASPPSDKKFTPNLPPRFQKQQQKGDSRPYNGPRSQDSSSRNSRYENSRNDYSSRDTNSSRGYHNGNSRFNNQNSSSRYNNDRYNDRYSGDSYNEYSSETSSRDSRDSSRDFDRGGYRNRRNDRSDNNSRGYDNNSYRREGDNNGGGRGGNYRQNDRNSSSYGSRQPYGVERNARSNTTGQPPSSESSSAKSAGANSSRGSYSEKRSSQPPKRSHVSVQNAMSTSGKSTSSSRNYFAEEQTDDSSDYYANGGEDSTEYPASGGYDARPYGEAVMTSQVQVMTSQHQQPGMQDWQLHQQHHVEPKAAGRHWRQGDYCLAKYFADGEFYNAVIVQEADHRSVCLVNFTEYGNTEECHTADIRQPKFMQPTQELPPTVIQYPVYQFTNYYAPPTATYAPPTAYIPAPEAYQQPITALEFTPTPKMYGQ